MDTILSKSNSRSYFFVLQFILLVAVAIVAPMTNNQFVAGPIVNATLFISAVTLGSPAAIMVGMIPSLFALSTGLLPAPLAPMVPFIIAGNALLVLVFNSLRRGSYPFSIVVSSFIKFLFLFATSSIVINILMKKSLAAQVAIMMSWPQFATALIGGLIAASFLYLVKRGDK